VKALVAGASGLVGRAAVGHFAALPEWGVVGVSRRPTAEACASAPRVGAASVSPESVSPESVSPESVSPESVSLDLMDAAACRAVAGEHPDVTHLVYAAVAEAPGLAPGWLDEDVIERNVTMLRNLIEALETAAPGLEHVSLLQGTKAYGLHAGAELTPDRFPLKERHRRVEHRNFYFAQEDYLRAHRSQRGADWGLTALRPTVVYGDAVGGNMNPLLPLLVYAAVLRERGEPLHRPWPADRSPLFVEAVDAALLAQALGWAATASAAREQTFNLTNGDVFAWEGIWPALADELDMSVGGHHPVSFAHGVRGWAGEWAGLVDRHQLAAPRELDAFVGPNSFAYADMVIPGRAAGPLPSLNSTVAIRQAGFTGCLDTEDMFRHRIRSLRRARMIPGRDRI
jgi:nucleoside-diphosphate-sugar epimerase